VKICVLVKEVPDAAVEKRINPSTGRLDRSGEKNLNPYDTHAIEAAMQLEGGWGGPGRRDRRRDHGARQRPACAAQGRLARARTARSTSATSRWPDPTCRRPGYALAQALAKESPDLVLLGQQSDDGECYTIGAVVADHLQMPSLTQVIKMDASTGSVRCERQAEYGYDTVEVELPAVISVGDAINEPRYPSLKAIMGAKKKPLEKVGAGDVGIDGGRVGFDGSQVACGSSRPRPRKPPAGSSRTRTRPDGPGQIVAWLDER
jgi:electron transfer flavoprotein beta subunit